jgi:capsid assembly protease
MAFLSGLGPRILGRRVELEDMTVGWKAAGTLPARASILAGGLLDDWRSMATRPTRSSTGSP